ncbi:MAG: hypothetical protein WBF90_15530 [Rivularia sp. (in: cyanobacteria)]|jgi:hypothetical protein
MKNIILSDKEIETLLVGKWRYNTDFEKIFLEFKDDMTYEQTRIQTYFLSKPKEYITGNKFAGVWHVNDRKVSLILKRLPKSILNLQLSKLFKLSIADMVASFNSLLFIENYQITKINNSKFSIMDEDELIVATKMD